MGEEIGRLTNTVDELKSILKEKDKRITSQEIKIEDLEEKLRTAEASIDNYKFEFEKAYEELVIYKSEMNSNESPHRNNSRQSPSIHMSKETYKDADVQTDVKLTEYRSSVQSINYNNQRKNDIFTKMSLEFNNKTRHSIGNPSKTILDFRDLTYTKQNTNKVNHMASPLKSFLLENKGLIKFTSGKNSKLSKKRSLSKKSLESNNIEKKTGMVLPKSISSSRNNNHLMDRNNVKRMKSRDISVILEDIKKNKAFAYKKT